MDNASDEAKQHLARRDFAGAVVPLQKLARVKPDAPGVFVMLGLCVSRSPHRRELLEAARKDLARDPNDLAALQTAACALPGTENDRERLEMSRRLSDLRPDDPDLQLQLAVEYANLHQYAQARPLIERFITRKPDDPMGFYVRGKITLEQSARREDLNHAEQDLRAAISRNQSFTAAHVSLGRVYLAKKEWERALAAFRNAQSLDAKNTEALYGLARANRLLGDAKAAAAAENALRQQREQSVVAATLALRCGAFPQDFDLHLKAARTLIGFGEYEKAALYLNQALKLRPRDLQARQLAAELQNRLPVMDARNPDAPAVSAP